MKKLIIILILLFSVNCFAVQISIENATKEKATFVLYWHDHNWKDQWYPAPVHGGEYAPNQIRNLTYDYPGRIFTLFVYQGDKQEEYTQHFKQDTAHVHYVWDGMMLDHEEEK